MDDDWGAGAGGPDGAHDVGCGGRLEGYEGRRLSSSDTILALASGAGRAGVAVIRVSGLQAGGALDALAGRRPAPRQAQLRALRHPSDGALIDTGLVLWFPAPGSFTGEDVCEFHIHGGQAVASAMIEALLALPGLRLAEPGEFTRRAFEHGKLDLTQAEGLADLIDAETEGQRRQALRQMQGALAKTYDGWRARLVDAIALVEAEIDFPDEDLPPGLSTRAAPLLRSLAEEVASHLDDRGRGERVRDGYRIAIIGAPNAGKSTLLNALAGREAAIVSDRPGTTRDVIEARLVLAGFPVWLADTAGLREAADAIEAEGVRRALARAQEADLRLIVMETGVEPTPDVRAWVRRGDWVVVAKTDLGDASSDVAAAWAAASGAAVHRLSAKTGEGLEALKAALTLRVGQDLGSQEAAPISRARHREHVGLVASELAAALNASALGAELAGEHLRRAAHSLGRLTGRVDVEEILGEIFNRFCIGK